MIALFVYRKLNLLKELELSLKTIIEISIKASWMRSSANWGFVDFTMPDFLPFEKNNLSELRVESPFGD